MVQEVKKRPLKEGEIIERMENGKIVRKRVVRRKKVDQGSKKSEKRGEKSAKNSKRKFAIIMVINCVVIALLGGAMLIMIHYALQSGTRHGVRAVVPDFQNLTMEQAHSIALEDDLRLVVNDSIYAPSHKRGAILDQIPQEGTIVKPGRTIYVTINATQQKMVDVPYVAGRSLRQAKSMLDVSQLTIEELIYVEDIATNYILAQYCNGKEVTQKSQSRALVGTGVTLKVGVDEAHNETIMPMLIGKAFYLVKNILWDAGLNVGSVTSQESLNPAEQRLAMVLSQSIPSDSLLRMGVKVDLELTQDRALIDTALFRNEQARIEAEMLMLREQEIADSLAMTMIDSTEVVEVVKRPKVERVDFEDLFN